jgi:hypothetical protein
MSKEPEADALHKTKDAQAAADKSSGTSRRDLSQNNPEWSQNADKGAAGED